MSFLLEINKKILKNLSKNQKGYGFTLLEFLVSLSIGLIILVGVVIGQAKYNDLQSLKATANEMSLVIRQAQIYGVSVRSGGSGQTDFSSPYGVFLDSVGSTNKYVYYMDKNKNGYFDGNYDCTYDPANECSQLVQITRGNRINGICRMFVNGTETCDVGRVDATFKRPSTEAKFWMWDNVGYAQIQDLATMKGIKVKLISPAGRTKAVTLYKTGQISVQDIVASAPAGSCSGTYNCSQWHGDQTACLGNGHTCTYSGGLCNGGTKSCNGIPQNYCSPTITFNCDWQ